MKTNKSEANSILGPIHTTPEVFKKEGFTLKKHEMFSFHTMLEEFKNTEMPILLDSFLRKTRVGNHLIIF